MSEKIAYEVEKQAIKLGQFGHGFTYSGHPVSSAVALKTLDIMEKLKSWEIITRTGKYLNKKWLKIANENSLDIKINGLPSISKFEIQSINSQAYKTFITQEMLKIFNSTLK